MAKAKLRKWKTDNKLDFLGWFPELDTCPYCKKGRTLFENFKILEITIKVGNFPNGPHGPGLATFTFKREEE